MDLEVSYTFENEQQFWDELAEIISLETLDHELIDNALRSYLSLTSTYKGEYIKNEEDLARCSSHLLQSKLFEAHEEYVRRQIIYSLIQDDSPEILHAVAIFLLLDGQQHEAAFEMMKTEGVFPRLQELIQEGKDDDYGLHKTIYDLLFAMARIQRLRYEDLLSIEDTFIIHMFQVLESLSDDVSDPYHYPVIRVLLVLNEQYMLSAHDPSPADTRAVKVSPTNKVVKVLASHGSAYKSFGQSIILVLNRESETTLQLLILKLLYLVFTSPPTFEYFYTNDLHVLLDIILRNLLDLPSTSSALRHTYLRVLHPFLSHSQLRHPPYYKRGEIIRLLTLLGESETDHFGAIDETTQRLVGRCCKIPWLRDELATVLSAENTSKQADNLGASLYPRGNAMDQATRSSLSVVEIAAQRSPPGIQTTSKSGRSKEPSSEIPMPDHVS